MVFDRNIVIRNLRNGDENSFKIVFEEFYQPLVTFANSYLFDRSESEDVVQNLFIKIWENCETLNIDRSIDSYLFTSVKNCCLNRLKSIKVQDKHDLLMLEGLLNYYKDHERTDPNLEEHLKNAISTLPPKIREIVLLKYAENKKIAEISKEMNISQNTVKTQLKRGKSKLREALKSAKHNAGVFVLFFIPF